MKRQSKIPSCLNKQAGSLTYWSSRENAAIEPSRVRVARGTHITRRTNFDTTQGFSFKFTLALPRFPSFFPTNISTDIPVDPSLPGDSDRLFLFWSRNDRLASAVPYFNLCLGGTMVKTRFIQNQYTHMVSFLYSHYTVQLVFPSEWEVVDCWCK